MCHNAIFIKFISYLKNKARAEIVKQIKNQLINKMISKSVQALRAYWVRKSTTECCADRHWDVLFTCKGVQMPDRDNTRNKQNSTVW
jgi:hypothetical protein